MNGATLSCPRQGPDQRPYDAKGIMYQLLRRKLPESCNHDSWGSQHKEKERKGVAEKEEVGTWSGCRHGESQQEHPKHVHYSHWHRLEKNFIVGWGWRVRVVFLRCLNLFLFLVNGFCTESSLPLFIFLACGFDFQEANSASYGWKEEDLIGAEQLQW